MTLVRVVKEAIDDKAWESGQMTSDRFQTILDGFKTQMLMEQREKLEELRVEVNQMAGGTNGVGGWPVGTTTASHREASNGCTYGYGGKLYSVPEGFEFPKRVTLRAGLGFWFRGISVGSDGNYVKPFRQLTVKSLPTKELQNENRLKWLGCFKILEDSEIYSPPRQQREILEETIESVYNSFIILLQERFKYCFRTDNPQVKWTIGTWAYRMTRSQVLKCGTQSDIDNLPTATRRNCSNNRDKNRKKRNFSNPLYPIRQQRRIENNNNNN